MAHPHHSPRGRFGHLPPLICSILLVLGGCASQSIVLVPDPDGHVGRVEVSTPGGKQVLSQAGETTRTRGATAAPTEVSQLTPEQIQRSFGEALAIEPPPPERFTLMFETGSTELSSDSRPHIPAIAAAVARRTAVRVSVSGHTDATGSDQVNDALALDRANAVSTLLQQQGVQPELISVSSHGKGNPAIVTPDGVAEPRNRRVVVIVR